MLEEVAQRLMEIEDDARRVVAQAKDAQERLNDDIKEADDKMRADIEKRVNSRCDKIKAYEDGEAGRRIEEIKSGLEKKSRALDESYAKNAAAWADDIFARIIS